MKKLLLFAVVVIFGAGCATMMSPAIGLKGSVDIPPVAVSPAPAQPLDPEQIVQELLGEWSGPSFIQNVTPGSANAPPPLWIYFDIKTVDLIKKKVIGIHGWGKGWLFLKPGESEITADLDLENEDGPKISYISERGTRLEFVYKKSRNRLLFTRIYPPNPWEKSEAILKKEKK